MRFRLRAISGLELPGADLNSQRLVRRMKYMDIFHNPPAYTAKDTGYRPPQMVNSAGMTARYSGQQWVA